MKPARPLTGEWFNFRVCCEDAKQVKLVIDFRPGVSEIFSLQQVDDGVWETTLRLPPGEYRFCYHIYDGRCLQYLTPEDWEVDGLKAVLQIPEQKTRPEPRDAIAIAAPQDCQPLQGREWLLQALQQSGSLDRAG